MDFNREENCSYLILGYPHHLYWTGVTRDGRQMLVVIQEPDVVGIFFAQDGSLLTVESRPLSPSTLRARSSIGVREVFRTEGDEELSNWLSGLGFAEAVIKVKRFFVPSRHVGIIDFPKDYEAVLRNPEPYTDDERSIAQQTYSKWFEEGLFVLLVGPRTDFWVTNTGEILAS